LAKKTQRRSDAFLPKSLQVSKIFPIFAPKIEDNMEQQTDIRWIQRYQKKKGTPIGDHIDRVGQVFYEAA